jgi:hypothetical protein
MTQQRVAGKAIILSEQPHGPPDYNRDHIMAAAKIQLELTAQHYTVKAY